MQEYKEYQSKLKEVEQEEAQSNDAVEQHVPAVFLLLFAFVSGAATYFLNEAGMRNSPLYARTIGAENAALLVLAILEGSFLTLTLFGHKILKSQPQRNVGWWAIKALKVVLSINILVSFVMLAGLQSWIMPLVRLYSQWGVPLTVIGAGWLWAHIVTNRRKAIMRNQMLDDAAEVERLWAEQHRLDQKRYRDAYMGISASPEMQAMRKEIAVSQAIEQIALQSGLTYDEAEQIYHGLQGRNARLPGPSAVPQIGQGQVQRRP